MSACQRPRARCPARSPTRTSTSSSPSTRSPVRISVSRRVPAVCPTSRPPGRRPSRSWPAPPSPGWTRRSAGRAVTATWSGAAPGCCVSASPPRSRCTRPTRACGRSATWAPPPTRCARSSPSPRPAPTRTGPGSRSACGRSRRRSRATARPCRWVWSASCTRRLGRRPPSSSSSVSGRTRVKAAAGSRTSPPTAPRRCARSWTRPPGVRPRPWSSCGTGCATCTPRPSRAPRTRWAGSATPAGRGTTTAPTWTWTRRTRTAGPSTTACWPR